MFDISRSESAEITLLRVRMTDSAYAAERARLRETYGDTAKQAGARFEQALATLFYRSGWTQDELATKEGKSQDWIALRLRFGRFLNFTTNVVNPGSLPDNLTEGRFRSYWLRTEGGPNERARFGDVLRLMQAEEPLRQSHKTKGYPERIVGKFGDSKWHSLPVIAKHLDEPEGEVEKSLAGMHKLGWGKAKTEMKMVGTVKHYRFYRNARMISSQELTDKLSPILDGLEAEGKKTMATMAPAAVAILAHKLRKLLKDWTE